MEIKGKGCVVTGAGSGIGRGIALSLADAGASGVVVADVQIDRAEAVRAELEKKGVRARAFRCDVSKSSDVDALADFAFEQLENVSILCNNAGIINPGPGFDTTDGDLRWQFEVNVYGVFFGCRAFGKRFLQQDGKAWIVNTASHHAVGTPTKGVATYVATKHAVLGFTDAYRLEYGDKIGFSVLCPGIINTELWDAGRNRPAEYGDAFEGSEHNLNALRSYGMSAELVGELVTKAIDKEEFFIWTHPFSMELIEKRYAEGKGSIERQWPHGPQEFHKRTPAKV